MRCRKTVREHPTAFEDSASVLSFLGTFFTDNNSERIMSASTRKSPEFIFNDSDCCIAVAAIVAESGSRSCSQQ